MILARIGTQVKIKNCLLQRFRKSHRAACVSGNTSDAIGRPSADDGLLHHSWGSPPRLHPRTVVPKHVLAVPMGRGPRLAVLALARLLHRIQPRRVNSGNVGALAPDTSADSGTYAAG